MGQGMRVTVDAAMRARDVSRIRAEDEAPPPAPPTAQDAMHQNKPQASQHTRVRRAERRRLAKRRAAQT